MDEPTIEQAQAMLERAETATPGTWATAQQLPDWLVIGDSKTQAPGCSIEESGANAAFIAAARTDVPLLAREVLRLRELLNGSADSRLANQLSAGQWYEIISDLCGMNADACGKLADLMQERGQLRESLNWALGQLVDLDAVRVHRPTRQLFCDYCSPHQGILAHRPDCPYARALKLVEEKP